MFSLKVQNGYGEQMELTNNPNYAVVTVDGFDPPDAIINTSRNAGYDGSVYNSAYVDNRLIVITLAVNFPAELNRVELYRYFKNKFPVRLFYKTESRDLYIDGYVQSNQIAYFDKKQTAQITVLCPRPYLNSVENLTQESSPVVKLFEFPFAIEEPIPFSEIQTEAEQGIVNEGDVETGVAITIHAIGAVTNPKIYNTSSGEQMLFTLTMDAGDDILINTRQGEKSVYLLHNGVKTNIIGSIVQGSDWIKMRPGVNSFMVNADSGALRLIVGYDLIAQYEGV